MANNIAIQKEKFELLLGRYDKVLGEQLGVSEEMFRKFKRSIITAAGKNHEIMNCNPASIIGACMSAAQIGLETDTPQQLAHLIPYKKNLTYQIGYKGLIDLAYQTGVVRNIFAEAVYIGDDFEVEMGTEPRIIHKPKFETQKTEENVTHIYAVVENSFGGRNFVVMSKKDIDDIAKKTSKAGTKGPWGDKFWWVEMGKKTVIKRIIKQIPQTPAAGKLFAAKEIDDMLDMGKTRNVVEGEVTYQPLAERGDVDEAKAEYKEHQAQEAVSEAEAEIREEIEQLKQ